MPIPEYWLERPKFELMKAHKEELEHLYQDILKNPNAPWIEHVPVPKWVFLCWLVEEKSVLLHGSSNPDISLFEPRAPDAKDDDEFSQQTAVFAASEGIWPMFYAILDRGLRPRFLNSAVRLELLDGWSDTRYFFSVNDVVFKQNPWREGAVYILPKEGFVLEPPNEVAGGFTVQDPHWANVNLVKPLAKLKILPRDFPFLAQVRGHDNDVVQARAKANPSGFPWLE